MKQKTELVNRQTLLSACENFGNKSCNCGYCNTAG